MGRRPVGVLVSVDHERAEGAEKHVAAQEDQNQPHDSLQRRLDGRCNGEPERNHPGARGEERGGVPGAPERAEDAGSDDTALSGHQRRDRGDVVGVERVAEPEEQPEPEGGDQ